MPGAGACATGAVGGVGSGGVRRKQRWQAAASARITASTPMPMPMNSTAGQGESQGQRECCSATRSWKLGSGQVDRVSAGRSVPEYPLPAATVGTKLPPSGLTLLALQPAELFTCGGRRGGGLRAAEARQAERRVGSEHLIIIGMVKTRGAAAALHRSTQQAPQAHPSAGGGGGLLQRPQGVSARGRGLGHSQPHGAKHRGAVGRRGKVACGGVAGRGCVAGAWVGVEGLAGGEHAKEERNRGKKLAAPAAGRLWSSCAAGGLAACHPIVCSALLPGPLLLTLTGAVMHLQGSRLWAAPWASPTAP